MSARAFRGFMALALAMLAVAGVTEWIGAGDVPAGEMLALGGLAMVVAALVWMACWRDPDLENYHWPDDADWFYIAGTPGSIRVFVVAAVGTWVLFLGGVVLAAVFR